jgi:hypothetical protein
MVRQTAHFVEERLVTYRMLMLASALIGVLICAGIQDGVVPRAMAGGSLTGDYYPPIRIQKKRVKTRVTQTRRRYRRMSSSPRTYLYADPRPAIVWYSGPVYRFQRDRDSCAFHRRECSLSTGYRTDDYYACVRGC